MFPCFLSWITVGSTINGQHFNVDGKTETWLHENINISVVKLPDYNFVREHRILANLYTKYDILICIGDFNIDFLNINFPLYTNLEKIMDAFNIKQILRDPIRRIG